MQLVTVVRARVIVGVDIVGALRASRIRSLPWTFPISWSLARIGVGVGRDYLRGPFVDSDAAANNYVLIQLILYDYCDAKKKSSDGRINKLSAVAVRTADPTPTWRAK
jgi:hypothetical protein